MHSEEWPEIDGRCFSYYLSDKGVRRRYRKSHGHRLSIGCVAEDFEARPEIENQVAPRRKRRYLLRKRGESCKVVGVFLAPRAIERSVDSQAKTLSRGLAAIRDPQEQRHVAGQRERRDGHIRARRGFRLLLHRHYGTLSRPHNPVREYCIDARYDDENEIGILV